MGAMLCAAAVLVALLALGAPAVGGQDPAKDRLQARIDRQLKAEEAGRPAEQAQATGLYREYSSNEVAADAKYKGKWVELRGVVLSVAKDLAGAPYISFAGDAYGVGQVQAVLFDVQIKAMHGKDFTACTALEKAAILRRGQKLVVDCMGAGSVLGVPRLGQCLVLPDGGQ